MKYYLKFTLLFAILVFVGCSKSNESIQEPISKSTHISRVAASPVTDVIPDGYSCGNIAIEIGQMHNQAMYDFVDYCNEISISPFDSVGFSISTICDFMEKYFITHFDYYQYYSICSSLLLHEGDTVFDKMNRVTQDLIHVLQHETMQNVIISMADIMKFEVSQCNDNRETILVETLCSLAMHSYYLWAFQWDWSQDGYIDYKAYVRDNPIHPISPAPISTKDIVGGLAGGVAGASTLSVFGVVAGIFIGGALASSQESSLAMDEEIHRADSYSSNNNHTTNSYVDQIFQSNRIVYCGVEMPSMLIDSAITSVSIMNIVSLAKN